jgi:phospholipase C
MRKRTGLWLIASSLVAVGCGSTASDVVATGTSRSPLSSDLTLGTGDGSAPKYTGDSHTVSPIKHVIVIIGENRTFDHLFATYKSPSGGFVDNLLSKKIINADGSPGPNFARSHQFTAVDQSPSPYQLSPGSKALYGTLPPPRVPGFDSTAPFTNTTDAMNNENGLETADYVKLTTGGTGSLTAGTPDTRIPNVNSLLPGVFQITGPNMTDDDYAGSPVHRFYQMWQQLDCAAATASFFNPSGCQSDLVAWVEQTIAAGSNGNPPKSTFNGEGTTALEFYNMQQGDLAYTKSLADAYTMSDNFHQSVEGGTGANHVMLMSGQAIWYTDGNGNVAVPPSNQIENPDPLAGFNNWYTQDGYSGGSYSDCADESQSGVSGVTAYLHQVHVNPNCEQGKYYLLNNYNPGYFGDGTVNQDSFSATGFTVPPAPLRTIGDTLLARNISWAYFGDQFNNYVKDNNLYDTLNNQYCNICNAFQYSSNIMTNAAVRTEHLKDTIDLYNDIAAGWLPAVSFVKPSGLLDGHPASSKWDLYEGFVRKIVDLVQANPALWDGTAILMTADEGGGYYDSGYVQPVDFFGDGTRIPLIAISKYSTGGHVAHSYTDHVSILKFIERNWVLPPVTRRSRDNLPNPIQIGYAPLNGAAIGDLFDMFDFGRLGG